MRWRWVDGVLADALLTPSTKVVLLALSRRMTVDGAVGYKRVELAAAVRLSERVVARHLQTAVEAGWLQRTGAGYSGRVATYAAVLPASERVTATVTLLGTERVTISSTLSTPGKGDDCRPPHIDRASVSERVAVNSSAADETTTTAAAAVATATHEKQERDNQEEPSLVAVVDQATEAREQDDVTVAVRVLTAFGRIRPEHSTRPVEASPRVRVVV